MHAGMLCAQKVGCGRGGVKQEGVKCVMQRGVVETGHERRPHAVQRHSQPTHHDPHISAPPWSWTLTSRPFSLCSGSER